MAWTYEANPFQNLFTAPTVQNTRDTIRFLIGDVDTSDQQLQDSEIDGLATLETPSGGICNAFQAAIQACVGLSGRYTRKANKTVGDLSIQYADIAQHYVALQGTIKTMAMRHDVPLPYAGGTRVGDMEIDREDDDTPVPSFRVGMTDDWGAGDSVDLISGGGFTQVVPG